ncbi:Spx/MgsR family RNA polymerase-binding regulatory protein [Nitrosomonas aestuarii]|uniref:Spx/MgsR family RNA polymerase-binding regulatory protein n=1 Tax=Nitrosomonas aestuarii TaxID=52441 RepID=UPI000D30E875|nr:Spx/MgsR family RNA polymerase-binding regulatory protein [Nitrosomonas aestuarii]PTN07959.1 arsenate reductase [Nitrosomonas aestuarii]
MLKFYGYKKCGACRKAEKFLQQAGIPFEFVDIMENPPSTNELSAIVELADTPVNNFFNTSGVQYRELKLKEKMPVLSNREKLALLAGNGRLIKRPLITNKEHATVGFNEEQFSKIWR